MRTPALLLAFIVFVSYSAMSQDGTSEGLTLQDTVIKATEFSIPKSGAFTLLGNNPANVSSPGFTKDIKLDYFLDKFSLQPNIAFEFQPVWLFGFKDISLHEYANKKPLARLLSTLSLSVGTHSENDIRKIAYSLKFTIAKDPMMDKAYLDTIQKILNKSVDNRMAADANISVKATKYRREKAKIEGLYNHNETRRLILQSQLFATTKRPQQKRLEDSLTFYAAELTRLRSQLDTIIPKLDSLNQILQDKNRDLVYNEQLKKELKDAMNAYVEDNWYKPKIDIGAGLVNTYQNESITQLGLKNNGLAVWVNPSVGFSTVPNERGKKGIPGKLLITGLFRYIDSEDASQTFLGGNLRYGSAKINLFAEYTWLKEGGIRTNSVAYGGNYMIGTKKAIEFGIRTDYDRDFDFKSIIPVIAFNWKLASEILK